MEASAVEVGVVAEGVAKRLEVFPLGRHSSLV